MAFLPVIQRVMVWINGLILLIAVFYGVSVGKPGAAFSEAGIVTYASGWQLYLCSFLCLLNGYFAFSRCRKLLSKDSLFWLVSMLGFMYLAFDEFFMYHESIDRYIHQVLALNETPLTDRLDDLLVGIYVGVAGLVVWGASRVRSFSPQAKRMFSIGLLVAVAMVVLDVMTNGPELMHWLFGVGLGDWLKTWLSVLEDALKLCIVFAFVNGLLINLDAILLQSRKS